MKINNIFDAIEKLEKEKQVRFSQLLKIAKIFLETIALGAVIIYSKLRGRAIRESTCRKEKIKTRNLIR